MIVSRGHGTYVDNDEVVASVAGTIERVNKLVTVRAMRTRYAVFKSLIDLPGLTHFPRRYNPEVGDLVIGRITEVHILLISVSARHK
jgi:exosome complex component RRP4